MRLLTWSEFTAAILSSTLQIVDKVYPQMQIMTGQKPQPYRVIAVQEDDKIKLKAGDRVV